MVLQSRYREPNFVGRAQLGNIMPSIKISALPVLTALTTTSNIVVVNAGNTYKLSGAALQSFLTPGVATSSVGGIVKVDGTSIAITNGVIRAVDLTSTRLTLIESSITSIQETTVNEFNTLSSSTTTLLNNVNAATASIDGAVASTAASALAALNSKNASATSATASLNSAGAAAASAVTASEKAIEAAASADEFAINFAQLATNLVDTQTIVVQHYGFN